MTQENKGTDDRNMIGSLSGQDLTPQYLAKLIGGNDPIKVKAMEQALTKDYDQGGMTAEQIDRRRSHYAGQFKDYIKRSYGGQSIPIDQLTDMFRVFFAGVMARTTDPENSQAIPLLVTFADFFESEELAQKMMAKILG